MVMAQSATSLASTSTTPTNNDDSKQASADFDTFLKLLTAQLKNQDPLDPADGTEFTAQLAQFSSLEQQINTNEHLKDLIDAQADTKQTEAMSYIGKEVSVPGSSFTLGTVGNIEFSYDVNLPIQSATASIYDSDGEKVRDFNVEGTEGIHDVIWDGRDAEGNRLETGIYTIKVEGHGAVDDEGNIYDPKLTSYFYSTAEKITKLGDSYAIMTTDGRTVTLSEVLATRSVSGIGNATSDPHATALQMLGKNILIPGSGFKYAGSDIGFTYGITKDVQAVSVTITDSEGNKVKQAPFDSTKGSHEYIWDGTDSNGDTVPEGEYTITIAGQDINSKGEIEEQNLDTFYYGTAEKVESQDGIVVVYTDDGRKAFYDEVISTK
ncbi:MAG: hypothetical protein GY793_05965 [Proteobacteria bacterium]|nr:hypothetical protein [Pseudomonadota bacterium]